MNQCDGCRAGKPLDKNGKHRMGEPGKYADLMACTADRYSTSKKLRPCPFCGTSDVTLGQEPTKGYYVYCCKCCIEGPWGPTVNKAERYWNARPPCPVSSPLGNGLVCTCEP